MNKHILTINFDTMVVGTEEKILPAYKDIRDVYNKLWNGAFSDKVERIVVINSKFISKEIIRASKVCLMRGIEIVLNNKLIEEWNDLNPYQAECRDFAERMQSKEESAMVLDIIIDNKELHRPYSAGLEQLHTFLNGHIKESGYDVSLSSYAPYDKLSCGTYEDRQGHKHEYSRNYTKQGNTYKTTLFDKLQMYLNIKWYQAHNFIPEYIKRDEDIVVPVSACDPSMHLYLYGDYDSSSTSYGEDTSC
jgi:hypothetical protein